MNQHPALKLIETLSIDNHTGLLVRTIEPVLQFAKWRVWEDQPDTHEPARQKALNNARECLANFPKEISHA